MATDINSILRSPSSYLWARKAIEAMEANNAWPTAVNFELWLHYVAAKDSEVASKIDEVLQSGTPFTEQVGQDIANQLLPGAKLNGEILQAGADLSAELDTVSRAIESARETSEAYGQHLASATQSLEDQDPATVRELVDNLRVATRKVQDENKTLETRLADTNAELSRLRENLEQVRRDAMTDALTKLANRKAFDECLEAACAQADQDGGVVTLAVVDIDHFKVFNDTWGHQTGDQVIRYVASVVGAAAEGGRFAARYGGEEYAVIFPSESRDVALKVLEKARVEISSRILKRRSTNEDLGTITISTGIAQSMPGESPAMLIERADQALYASKNSGRNRTTLAGEESEAQAA